MNYIKKLKKLKISYDQQVKLMGLPNFNSYRFAETAAELDSEMRNSLDLWLELAEAAEDVVKHVPSERLGNYDEDWMHWLSQALAKLRGESRLE